MKFLVINGPNLNLLGIREPAVYGKGSYAALLSEIRRFAKEKKIRVKFYQSNHEGDLVDAIQKARGRYDGIVINPGAYTHTSIALLDALKAVALPAVEVHISDLAAREAFRQVSYLRAACLATVAGKGFDGYTEALSRLIQALSDGSAAGAKTEESAEEKSEEKSGEKTGEKTGQKTEEKSGEKSGQKNGQKNGQKTGQKTGETPGGKTPCK